MPLCGKLKCLPAAVASAFTFAISAQADTVFDKGTIFVEPGLVTENDPSTFVGVTDLGTDERVMFDRRTNGFETYEAFLFKASFSNDFTIEIQVNPEFGSIDTARRTAVLYSGYIGQLPSALLADVETVWIHRGTQPFGGGNNNLLIHTGQASLYTSAGILEETLIHEAVHTSLDAIHGAASGWLNAQKEDGIFISPYAAQFPNREDLAETFLLYLGATYLSDRMNPDDVMAIQDGLTARMEYLEAQEFDLSPLIEPKP